MNFQSASYLLFLPLVWGVAMVLPVARWRHVVLLVASALFYIPLGSGFAVLLAASALFNYAWAMILRRRRTARILWCGVLANLAPLVWFKYAQATLALLDRIGATSAWSPKGILVPVGISFFTFQAISYLVDVYRERDVNPSLTEFVLYMAFWPTILSGPICRAAELVPQFREMARPSWDDLAVGSRRIVTGLFMKVVLADTLARGLDAGEGVSFGFDRVSAGWGAPDVLFLAIGFGFQLFFDFAGYSNIAIGSARLFGLRLRENFDAPYLSKTISEFWTRWHMSLSFWIRDYVFFPLATARSSVLWRNVALVVAMTAFGIWHGAAWTFFLWGLFQGLLLVGHRGVQQIQERWVGSRPSSTRTGPFPSILASLGGLVGWGLTFVSVSLGWILFRANSLAQAGKMYGALLAPSAYRTLSLRPNFYVLVVLVVGGYFASKLVEAWLAKGAERPTVRGLLWATSPVYYAALIVTVIVWSKQASTFVYVQF